MNGEALFLGACPIIRPEGIYYDGRRVIRFGMDGVGVGDVGDLLAYRQEWEPFIGAHLALWRQVNDLLEGLPEAQQCPAGVFPTSQIQNLDATLQAFCASLSLSRMYTSDTDPSGILTQWNAWANKSSADIVAGASSMLQWHQQVVMRVGGSYKDDLVKIAQTWKIDIQLPNLPTFSTQQQIIAQIQGAYIATKGILQIIGYGIGDTLVATGDIAQATAQGLKDTVKELPKTFSWMGAALVATVVLVGGALVVYYVPRRPSPPALSRP